MGIDPGTTRTGYGVLEVGENGRLYAVALGDIDLRRLNDHYHKLRVIFERVSALIDGYHPDEVALESPFFGNNPQSILKLGRAQGVAMAAALSRGIDVWEYAPRRVKQAITGRGAAAKEQVAAMLGGMLGIEYDPARLDATDGMAVALCHHFVTSSPILRAGTEASGGVEVPRSSRRKTSWETFLRQNPGREIKKSRNS
ncbi:MAG: crossover junction endodeoxyribonuclease RuvC [Alistipes sp.]|jgi:crossover junction endodeoxyribonuclease RuvC|nr:crossover junction endodeoxyribonuclease RuvC [Alistipes sp.]